MALFGFGTPFLPARYARVSRSVPFHSTSNFAGFVGAELARAVAFPSRDRVNRVSTVLTAIDHEGVAVLPYVIPGNALPVFFTKRGTGIAPLQTPSITSAPCIAGFGHGSFNGIFQ